MVRLVESVKTMPKGLRYKRRGECNQCGECCKNEDCADLEFCEGNASCAAHPATFGGKDTREPKCGRFPQAPPIVIDGCGYYFIDTWEGDRVLGSHEV